MHRDFNERSFHTMPNLDSLEELLQDELKDIYDAEKQLTKALPKLAKRAGATQLKNAFEEHLRQTERHVERLEEAFEYLGMPARGKKCEGMKHLIAEGDEMIGEVEDEAARDAIMIASAQKVEHYEIASYGTLRTWATLLGKPEVAALMEETLEEEKDTDQTLTGIAESFANERAAEGEEDETGEAENETAPRGRGVSVRQRRATAAEQPAASRQSRRRR
jgi:ferritin-like metal-binding protein YciE